MNADLRILHRFAVQNPQISNFSSSIYFILWS